MHACIRGVLSAMAATALLVLLLWANASVGPVKALDLPALLARVLGESRGTGWAVLLLVSVPGFGLVLAALLEPTQTAPPWGLALGLSGGGWLACMMGLLPMAGYAPFGLAMGLAVPFVTLLWAAGYGATLALSWHWLPRLPGVLQHWRTHLPPVASLRS